MSDETEPPDFVDRLWDSAPDWDEGRPKMDPATCPHTEVHEFQWPRERYYCAGCGVDRPEPTSGKVSKVKR